MLKLMDEYLRSGGNIDKTLYAMNHWKYYKENVKKNAEKLFAYQKATIDSDAKTTIYA
jgi:hypothetical protein